jgi:sugar phosphate isomerase/epimerase
MTSRRRFLTALAAGAGAVHFGVRSADAQQIEMTTALNGPVGLQLWSLRKYLPNDLPATLGKVRAMGFREVEAAGLYHHTVTEFRMALDTAGLRCQSAHTGFGALRDHAAEAFAEAKALGATGIVCPWIDHGQAFTHDDAMKAAEVFNRVGAAAKREDLSLSYHCHGYEFVPSTEGTLFDTLAGATDPATVAFQIDVLHAFLGGADPAALITRYGARVKSLHLKDLKKGFPVKAGTAIAPAESDVPLGTGPGDMPAALRAAIKAGVPLYYVEDESDDPLGHIPASLAYLTALKL